MESALGNGAAAVVVPGNLLQLSWQDSKDYVEDASLTFFFAELNQDWSLYHRHM